MKNRNLWSALWSIQYSTVVLTSTHSFSFRPELTRRGSCFTLTQCTSAEVSDDEALVCTLYKLCTAHILHCHINPHRTACSGIKAATEIFIRRSWNHVIVNAQHPISMLHLQGFIRSTKFQPWYTGEKDLTFLLVCWKVKKNLHVDSKKVKARTRRRGNWLYRQIHHSTVYPVLIVGQDSLYYLSVSC